MLCDAIGGICRYLRDARANVGIIFALGAVPIVALAGSAVDYVRASSAHSVLQHVTDAAALAAISRPGLDEEARVQLAHDVFAASLANSVTGIKATPTVTVSGDKVTVESSAAITTAMLGLIHVDEISVAATSVAVKAPEPYLACVLALDPSADHGVSLVGTADLTASECAVQANSSSAEALSATGTTTATASAFCAVGGHTGGNFSPTPVSGCAPVHDPFAYLAVPDSSGCDYTDIQFGKGSHTASPGVYCGGLELKAHAEVSLEPGVYVLKDGALSLNAHSSIDGAGVVFWLTGAEAVLHIRSHSSIDISAPASGDYAGVAIAQDPAAPDSGQQSSIEGGGSVKIVGSIYLPTHVLKVGGGGDVGGLSDYMPLVAKSFVFHGNSSITVNLDADAAGMPAEQMPPTSPGEPRLLN